MHLRTTQDTLLDPVSPLSKQLRGRFVFYIVPMVNPDGVIVGNYRCSLSGQDLNRVWDRPSPRLHPEIFFLKDLLKQLTEQSTVALFCDLHGHSRRKDVFLYGCEHRSSRDYEVHPMTGRVPGSIHVCPGIPMAHQEKVLPFLLYRRNPRAFTFRGSCWKVQRSKESTARVVGWREMGLVNSFTLEASFCGPSSGDHHFSVAQLEELGRNLGEALIDFDRLHSNEDQAVQLLRDMEGEIELMQTMGPSEAVSDSEGSEEEPAIPSNLARVMEADDTLGPMASRENSSSNAGRKRKGGGRKKEAESEQRRRSAGSDPGSSSPGVSALRRTSIENLLSKLPLLTVG